MSSMIRSCRRAALVAALVSSPLVERARAQSDEVVPQPTASDAVGGVVAQLTAQARALAAKGRMDQAAEVWLKVLRSRPDHAEALEGLGLWHANAGRTQKAREQLAQLEHVAPGSPGAVRLRAALSVGKDFDALVNQARGQVKAGKLAAAITSYERAFGGAAPPERLALEYYQTLGGTEAGWEPARKGLVDYAAAHPDNGYAQLALALHLTYRESSRRDGIDRLRTLAKSDALRTQAQGSWRKALLWLQASAADAPRYRAYLDEVGPDHDLSTRLGQLSSAVTVVQRGNTVQAGFAALERADTAEATQQFERAGDLPEALVGLGLVALHDEDFELAVKLLDKASQRAPTRTDLWEKPLRSARFWERVKRGQKLMAANDHAAAETLLREALQLSPEESFHARIALAQLLRKTDRLALAEQELQAALTSKPSEPNVLRALVDVKLARNDLEGALESNTQLVAIDPARAWPQAELSAEVMRRRAAEQRAHGDLDAARKLLVQAAERAPKLYWVQHDLVSIELELGALDPARGRLGALIDLDPNEPAGRVLRARIENELGRPETALELLRGLPPEAAGGQVGALQKELGLRHDVARLVRSSQRLGAFGARRELLKLQRIAGSDPSLLSIIALGFADVGETDRAVQLMQDAIASRPTVESGMSLQLAAIYLRAGRDAELRELLEELASDPNLTPRARRDLSKLHVAFAVSNADQLATAGDYTRALALLEPLLTEYPDEPGLLCALGRLFVASADYPDAAATFERVLARDPNNLEAREGAVSVAQMRRDQTRAGRLVEEGLARLPNRARMHLIAARYELSENDDAAAMRELTRARELAEKGDRGGAHNPQLAAALVPTEAAGLVARARARLAAEEVLPAIEGRALIDAITLEIDRIGQRHRVSITAEPSVRYRAGEVGLGRLFELRAPLTVGVPLGYFGKVEVGVTAV
ncbi:MAG: tetratricopeptide repeat protein, partial [Polyangiales bacterium]